VKSRNKAAARPVREPAQPAKEPIPGAACRICGKPATRLVDGDPSCETHAELVYEDQVEKYTQEHLRDGFWLEKN
jgi:hypothetical protein